MIDLAPGHKQGLEVTNPILLGAGSVGLGEAVHADLELKRVGAVVVGPVSATSRAGATGTRTVGLPGGALFATGAQNRGLEATLRHAAPLWGRIGAPVIVQLVEWSSRLGRMAERLSRVQGVAGLELSLPPRATGLDVARLCASLERAAELPFWVKLPQGEESCLAAARAAAGHGAAALVVAEAPNARALDADGTAVDGLLFAPSLFALQMRLLDLVAGADLGLPLILSGGVYCRVQVAEALRAGAAAVQLDALAWIEPTLPGAWAAEF